MPVSLLRAALFAAAVLGPLSAWAAELSVDASAQKTRGIKVLADGKLFAEYRFDDGPKPYVWPIVGPTGAEMTRAYPMKEVPGEKQDHYHHRSLWFTHMEVNGINFWAEDRTWGAKSKGADEYRAKLGRTVHREFNRVDASSDRVTLTTTNDWIGPQGEKVLEDERTLTFRAADDVRTIDFDITLKATAGDVLFGDNKDGTFGVRVPTSMDVDGGHGGRIVNSEGQTDKDAWGKAARWVDYHGPVQGETVGIAILNHPSSFRYPTTWHVRTYGLFCANPFGWHDFEPNSGKDGSYTLPKGESLRFRYRLLFHKGDEKAARIAEAFEAYAKEP